MASLEEPTHAKRPHVKTERMQEFIRSQGEASSPQKLLKCPEESCNKVFTSAPGLKYHIQTHCNADPRFTCDKCHKGFKSANGLKYHLGKTRCEDSDHSAVPGDQMSTGLEQVTRKINYDIMSTKPGLSLTENTQLHCPGNEKTKKTKAGRMVPPPLKLSGHSERDSGQLVLTEAGVGIDKLTELAIIATSPQSPLMQKAVIPPWDRKSHSLSLDSKPCGPPLDLIRFMPSVDQKQLVQVPSLEQIPHSPPWAETLHAPPWGQHADTLSLNPKHDIPSQNEKSHISSKDQIHGETFQHNIVKSEPDITIRDHTNTVSKVTGGEMPGKDSGNDLSDANGNYVHDGSDPRVSSSSPLPVSQEGDPLSSSTWSHPWPTAVWQCFIKGTLVKFLGKKEAIGPAIQWIPVERLAQQEELSKQATVNPDNITAKLYAPNGLRVVNFISHPSNTTDQSNAMVTFCPDHDDQPEVMADVRPDHPFFVKDKGWSSLCPEETVVCFGIPCRILTENDVCLPPTHKDAAFSNEVFESFKGFTAEDTKAVFALNSMRKKKGSDLSPKSVTGSPKRKCSGKLETPLKAKRPMNAFMLFAKETRLEFTQQFPRRDNRAISVMLGERWKSLSLQDRQRYEDRARLLAEEQKKIHPDCWKRKK